MNNYWFRVSHLNNEQNVYILAESYDEALDKLFNGYNFINYEFLGLK